ncbi:MAG: transcriptional coactivator p15/PC4 family protein [Candidatus Pacearchaeota archaeon]|nr:transcriptional coactivator p15/PC4 family protein [Candidatus Pacearchaeota archaeon]MDE1848982.1 transcriptional coactivator p15/PC4 family protein [Nanoarchaeota archaeon]
MDKEIGKINRGEFQGTATDIIVAVREYNGKVGVDIREYATSDKYSGPTKKGLRIPAEHFSEFKRMINSITEKDLVPDSSGNNEKEGNHQETFNSKKFRVEKPGSGDMNELPDY